MGAFRGGAILAGFFALTVPLMPVQALLLRASPKRARTFPHWYHRQVCRLLGIRISIDGEVARDRPVLLVANHTTWLDIPVLSAVAPVSFVAKKEVGNWPFVASLARLQRSVFVDRTRRIAVGQVAGEIVERLAQGDAIVLFAEGTSSDGNRVLPFMTSLFAAAKPPSGEASAAPDAVVQTLSVVYTRLHGVPLGRTGATCGCLVR
ncbi:MAG: 1-acyl-sn-glycerol-3-phosphate acyltransferase [Hyphomicrobium sp.]|nr:1-acyl-sn-glycerol-3-phosphate acyltransferase [Hyphomicrobium sp.]